MSRFYWGLGLLILLLVFGLFLTEAADRIQQPITGLLEEAAEAGICEDWTAAQQKTDAAQQRWEAFRRVVASFTDHEPMEEVDSEFARLDAFLRQRDPAEFAAVCAGLSRLTEAIAESQAITWWSLL